MKRFIHASRCGLVHSSAVVAASVPRDRQSPTYPRFTSDAFLRQTPPGENVGFVMTWLSYRF